MAENSTAQINLMGKKKFHEHIKQTKITVLYILRQQKGRQKTPNSMAASTP
jgi:hypothetical protein